MPANSVTIDNYNVETHQRYATDQERLDHSFIKDSSLIPTHFEMTGGRSTIASKWEELFETHLHYHPFASFAPPPQFGIMRNRFFTYTLSSEFDWVDDDHEDDDREEEEKKEKKQFESYKKKIQSKKSKLMPAALLEQDRNALLNLLDSIQTLNGLLREVHARKLQYQKG